MFTSGMFRHKNNFTALLGSHLYQLRNMGTHTENSRVIGDLRRFVLLWSRGLFDPQIFHITAAEHDVFVIDIRWWDFLLRIALSTFCSK
jgi:hypothetical protein